MPPLPTNLLFIVHYYFFPLVRCVGLSVSCEFECRCLWMPEDPLQSKLKVDFSLCVWVLWTPNRLLIWFTYIWHNFILLMFYWLKWISLDRITDKILVLLERGIWEVNGDRFIDFQSDPISPVNINDSLRSIMEIWLLGPQTGSLPSCTTGDCIHVFTNPRFEPYASGLVFPF